MNDVASFTVGGVMLASFEGIPKVGQDCPVFMFGGPAQRRRQERLRDELAKSTGLLSSAFAAGDPPFADELAEFVVFLVEMPLFGSERTCGLA